MELNGKLSVFWGRRSVRADTNKLVPDEVAVDLLRAAIENLLLASHVLGLGACWLGVHPRESRIAALRSLLGIPSSVIPVSVIALGYPAEHKEPRTRYRADYVHRNQW